MKGSTCPKCGLQMRKVSMEEIDERRQLGELDDVKHHIIGARMCDPCGFLDLLTKGCDCCVSVN